MVFRLRKSVRIGPLKFNLSKSGIGVSAGIKGFRVGRGPRGNYIHIGKGGLSYRHTFSKPAQLNNKRPETTPQYNERADQAMVLPSNTYDRFEDIDSGEISQMVDSTSETLVKELNTKRKKWRLWPIVAMLSCFTLYLLNNAQPPGWVMSLGGFAALVLTSIAAFYDTWSKSVVIMYDIEDECHSTFEQLHNAFDKMKSCKASWHLQAQANVTDKKYHAGADSLVKRNAISLQVKNPPYVKTNVNTPCIPVGSQTLYFFPDKVLVFEAKGIGAVSYENLQIALNYSQFIESQSVPRDAKVVDHTWKYVNKRGGPDKRFSNNHQIPVVLYQDVHFRSRTGLNECIQLSCTDIADTFVLAINKVGNMLRG